jgi:hypothetical protein
MKRFTLTLNIPRPFPRDAVNLIRSIGLSSHLHFTEVLAAPQGFTVQGIYPDDWTKDQISEFSQQLQESVRSAFADVLRHEAAAATVHAKEPPAVILFLAANPVKKKHLALDEEARDIEAKIRASEHRESLEFKSRWAVRADDLIHALNEDQPTIVHFSGHGAGVPGIVVQGDDGKPKLVDADALGHLFATLKDKIRIVVLNACYTVEQAAAIGKTSRAWRPRAMAAMRSTPRRRACDERFVNGDWSTLSTWATGSSTTLSSGWSEPPSTSTI